METQINMSQVKIPTIPNKITQKKIVNPPKNADSKVEILKVKESSGTIIKIEEMKSVRSITSSEISNIVVENCLSRNAIFRNLGNICSNQLIKYRGIISEKMSGASERPVYVYTNHAKNLDLKTAKTNELLSYIPYALRKLEYQIGAPVIENNHSYFVCRVDVDKIVNLIGITIEISDMTAGSLSLSSENLLLNSSIPVFICNKSASKNAKILINKWFQNTNILPEYLLFIKENDSINCYISINNNLSNLTTENLLILSKIHEANEDTINRIKEPYARFQTNRIAITNKLKK